MNSNYFRFLILAFRFSGWKLGALLVFLAFTRTMLATDPIYQNFSALYYTIPGSPPPTIDATNFDNENQFNVSFNQNTINAQFYEPKNTVNYTNNGDGIHTGVMTVNSPIPTNNLILFNFSSVGFQFDTFTTNVIPHRMAGTFYNAGDIRCDSVIDGNNLFFDPFTGTSFFVQLDIGECLVWATNIINPGSIDASQNGIIQLSGQNVDLSRGVFTLEQSTLAGVVNLSASGAVGTDAFGDWNPAIDLGFNYATSSIPDNLVLTNSTSYFYFNGIGTSNIVVRVVFIENDNTNVPYNIYLGVVPPFGSGEATVEWVGAYVDPATGVVATNYLYLNDDYAQGASTNVVVIGGVPSNFYFYQTNAPVPLGGPAAAGFSGVFNSGPITNPYAYFNAQLIPSTVATNASASNPSGALTNLPGQIQIAASRELNLNLAQISGPNYMSLTATNQFDGSGGALITSPYSDINLGVTNGFMVVSNLLEANIPIWSGTIQAWSTRWTNTDVNGINWDYRVELVKSRLLPVSASTVQNLKLHGTNSLVISDVLNVIGSLYFDAQRLTLTTNFLGNGATSPDGELNWNAGGGNVTLGVAQMPNLLWLTNNGAIRVPNLAVFSGNTTVTNVTAGTPAIAATNMLSQLGSTNVANNDTATIGSRQYTFVTTLSRHSSPNQIAIGATFDGSMSNFIAAINGAPGSGTRYGSGTTSNAQVTAGLLANHAFTVKAIVPGTNGNSIATKKTSTHFTWNGLTLSGGANSVSGTTNSALASMPYGAFINNGLLSDQGTTIWADNFVNGGAISNGVGNFALLSLTATLTNSSITAGGNVSITTGSMLTSNLMLHCGSLTLTATNLLTDSFDPAATNIDFWSVGNTNGTGGNGFALTILPLTGDLHGTTISNYAPGPNKQVINTWAGHDLGASTSGYTNNEAVGRLVLDALGATSSFQFNGTTTSNALYVDSLVLLDYASYTNHNVSGDIPSLAFNNLVIYYADATIAGGVDVAEKLNHKNGDHLRWVTNYAGYFSSTNFVYPAGVTNGPFNVALMQSQSIDSDGDGVVNANDTVPFFTSGMINLTLVQTNLPPLTEWLTWNTVPNATNYVFYTTNLLAWSILTNATVSSSPPGSVINSTPTNFVVTFSSGTHPMPVPVTVSDPNSTNRYYRVRVDIKQ